MHVPPVPAQKLGTDTPVEPDRSLAYTQQYASAVLDLGRVLSLPVVDLYIRLQSVPGWQTALLKDGLHFTPAGSRAVWQELKAVLDTQATQLRWGA
jgi:lysophospholipase L1-like esterase